MGEKSGGRICVARGWYLKVVPGLGYQRLCDKTTDSCSEKKEKTIRSGVGNLEVTWMSVSPSSPSWTTARTVDGMVGRREERMGERKGRSRAHTYAYNQRVYLYRIWHRNVREGTDQN